MENQIDSEQAYEKIRPFVLGTPIVNSLEISEICQAEVNLKCEHLQYTGSFKLRGATNKILSLLKSHKKEGSFLFLLETAVRELHWQPVN